VTERSLAALARAGRNPADAEHAGAGLYLVIRAVAVVAVMRLQARRVHFLAFIRN
jgi:hypothetical protein